MKNIIIGISTIFLGIILTFTVMSVNASMTVKNDATNALADSVEESVENCMEDKSYSIASKDEFVSDLVQNLSVGVENTSDLKVDIVKADKEKGIMSIKVESTFLYPNGSKGTATTEKTVIFEQNYKKRHTVPVKYLKYIPDDPTTISVNEALLQPNSDYYNSHPNMLLKQYMLTTGDKFIIPDEIPTSPSGSQFLYWKTETNKIITKDTIVDDSYIPEGQNTVYLVPFFKDEQQTYTVKFNGNGATSGTMPDQEYIVGSGTTLTKNTFERKYKISLNLNGGRLADKDTLTTYEVSAKFLGWSTDPNSTTATVQDENTTDLGSNQSVVNLYAVWAPAPVNLPNAMKGDSNLSKWMADNKNYNAGDRVEITKDTDFTAAYNTKMCAVRFSTIGVLGADQFTSVAQGTDITLPDTTLTGFACAGWYDGDTKVGNIGDKVTVNSDMSLTAKFIESKTTINYYDANKKLIKTENISYGEHISSDMPSINYTITFDTNGADAIAPMEQTNNFECWVDDEKKEYQAGTVLTSTKPTLNLYAVVNKGYLMLPQNSKAGYQFKGWYLDGGRLGAGGATYQFTRSCTVKAEYQRTVTFTVKYGNGAPDSVYTGSTGDTYSIGMPTRDDYTFTGWSRTSGDCNVNGDKITFGAQDSTITAQWKLKAVPTYLNVDNWADFNGNGSFDGDEERYLGELGRFDIEWTDEYGNTIKKEQNVSNEVSGAPYNDTDHVYQMPGATIKITNIHSTNSNVVFSNIVTTDNAGVLKQISGGWEYTVPYISGATSQQCIGTLFVKFAWKVSPKAVSSDVLNGRGTGFTFIHASEVCPVGGAVNFDPGRYYGLINDPTGTQTYVGTCSMVGDAAHNYNRFLGGWVISDNPEVASYHVAEFCQFENESRRHIKYWKQTASWDETYNYTFTYNGKTWYAAAGYAYLGWGPPYVQSNSHGLDFYSNNTNITVQDLKDIMAQNALG